MPNTTIERPLLTSLSQYMRPAYPARPSPRDPAAAIADLLQRRLTPTRSREEQAFIDMQHSCN